MRTPAPVQHEEIIERAAAALSSPASYERVAHRSNHDVPMPSVEILKTMVRRLQSVLFPGYFGRSDLKPQTLRFHIGAALDEVHLALAEQIERGLCFACPEEDPSRCPDCRRRAHEAAAAFIGGLPDIRHQLALDVESAFKGDPAAKSPGETIFCYPSILALTHHRIAHALERLDVPLIPRIISEIAHGATGIDIHPGASIGDHFFMDHGTGIVIGETCTIGAGVRIYQGVTLGARSFPLDPQGRPIKGIPRHPIVEDEVIIYSGATLLGRITIGRGSIIGGNVWLTRDVPPHSRIMQGRFQDVLFDQGSGI
jgi:serine O-acetyltransferase